MDTLEDVMRIAKKNEVSLESTLIISLKDTTNIHSTPLRASSLTSTLYPSNTPSRMEAAMEQLVSQMTQLSVHLLQPQTFRDPQRYSNKVQCYAFKKMSYVSRICPNHDATGEGLHQDELLLWMTRVKVV